MKQMDYVLLFFFPIALGFVALGVLFMSASFPGQVSAVNSHLLSEMKGMWWKTAMLLGGLAILQLLGNFYLVQRIGRNL